MHILNNYVIIHADGGKEAAVNHGYLQDCSSVLVFSHECPQLSILLTPVCCVVDIMMRDLSLT